MADTEKAVCGIIMPISTADEVHTAAHWIKVKEVLEAAILAADCTPRPVWESGDYEVIQGGILQNLFENEIAVCDISTRNSNVMLEWGMRLTTKKPTVVIAEEGTLPPFDTGDIKVRFYDPKLEWPTASRFIAELSDLIRSTLDASRKGTFKPFLEHFQFETVTPGTVSVTAEEKMEHILDRIDKRLRTIEDDVEANRKMGALTAAVYDKADFTRWVTRRDLAAAPSTLKSIIPNSDATPMYQIGDIVRHDKFGDGEVEAIEGNKVLVNFENIGVRRVIDAFLEPIA